MKQSIQCVQFSCTCINNILIINYCAVGMYPKRLVSCKSRKCRISGKHGTAWLHAAAPLSGSACMHPCMLFHLTTIVLSNKLPLQYGMHLIAYVIPVLRGLSQLINTLHSVHISVIACERNESWKGIFRLCGLTNCILLEFLIRCALMYFLYMSLIIW